MLAVVLASADQTPFVRLACMGAAALLLKWGIKRFLALFRQTGRR